MVGGITPQVEDRSETINSSAPAPLSCANSLGSHTRPLATCVDILLTSTTKALPIRRSKGPLNCYYTSSGGIIEICDSGLRRRASPQLSGSCMGICNPSIVSMDRRTRPGHDMIARPHAVFDVSGRAYVHTPPIRKT